MSISRRTRYLGIYSYSDTGTEGVPVDTWTFDAAHWGRVDDVRGKQVLRAGGAEVQVDAELEFSDEAVIPANCIVVDGTRVDAATAYHVRYLLPKSMHRLKLVYAQRIDRNKIDASKLLLDGSFILDGSEILNGVGV
ncbi:MAG TPA: hypothetical protein VK636_23640 [Gemmatimonadaceae bacterium]|nr:hypothetical protein [Gemmatimonadaceae bacterium]